MKIGELAKQTGLSRDAIRFYEREGLIVSSEGASDTNNYRDYSDEMVLHLNFIVRAREAGLTIADIKALQNALSGACDAAVREKVVAQKIEELEQSIEKSKIVIQLLKDAI